MISHNLLLLLQGVTKGWKVKFIKIFQLGWKLMGMILTTFWKCETYFFWLIKCNWRVIKRLEVKVSKCFDWAETYKQWSLWHSKHLSNILKFNRKGSNVKFKDAPIELKINGNDSYYLVDMLNIFGNWFKGIKGVQLCACSHFSGYTTNLFTCRLTYLAPFARAQFLVKLGGMPPNLFCSCDFFPVSFFLLSSFSQFASSPTCLIRFQPNLVTMTSGSVATKVINSLTSKVM